MTIFSVFKVAFSVRIVKQYLHLNTNKTLHFNSATLDKFSCNLYWPLRIGHLHDGVILLLQPESFRVLLSCANEGFCYLILAGITKFKNERKNVRDSGPSSKMTPLCKWPTALWDRFVRRNFTQSPTSQKIALINLQYGSRKRG